MSNSPSPGRASRWLSLLDHARRYFVLLFVFAVVTPLGCNHGEASEADAATKPPELPYFEDGVIKLPEVFAEKAALQTGTVEMTEVSPVVHVTGVLEFDELRIAEVGSRISGRVKEVKVIEGTKVEMGDVLATLDSAELGKAQAEISAVVAKAELAERDKERKRRLLQEGIASQRAADLASAEVSVASAELRAAKQRVQALGGGSSDKAALGVMSLTAPIEGDVVRVRVFRGQAVEPSYTAFTIADRTTLWVRLSVFEGEVVNIRVGDSVEISSQVTPDEVLTGTVTFVSTVLDPVTRSAEVRVVVPNEAGKLRVGQAVNARIRPGAARKQALAIPRKAMVQVDGKPTVFVEVGERAVMPRTIEVGAQGPDLVEIKKGLEPGERIVTEGVFALKSELFR
ncbi:efflux RND transporter periplasmic adaptor subunit [Nannocystis sp. SCPEA4]|uniref:efflux RND transporter periplasmic adaptor subunit n=1 Tax=Nannocystis sp. SCPEA4 TaxID=2996787 RepID=UPI00226E6015|nr:efflux RND transporter periplasmic adaptor subunit [Nannocystis sp. SCPEA4]MCY1061393.1 efflux RND transporter periplasmic adaptor subunit [Nannocystis sp. SCPEA4]